MGGQSSKQIFSNIITQLSASDVPPTEHEFWDEFWKSTLPCEEIFELMGAEEIRKLIRERPTNVRTMFTQVC